MAIFNKVERKEEDKQFQRHVHIVGREAFLVILGLILIAFCLFRYPLIFASIRKVEKALQSIIFGLVFAYLVDPVASAYKRLLMGITKNHTPKSIKTIKKLSVLLGMITGIAFIVAFVSLIIPGIAESISKLVAELPGYAASLQESLQSFSRPGSGFAAYVSRFIDSATKNLEATISTQITSWGAEVVSAVTSGVMDFAKVLINLFIGIIVAIYLLFDKEKAIGQMKKLTYTIFSRERADSILEVARQGNAIFSGFIRAKIVDSLIIGVICLIFCLIFRMPYALLIGAIVTVTNIIPFFGPFIGAIPSALLILMVDPVKCLIFIIFIIVLQQIDGNIIGPHIMGNHLNLNEFWITFSIMLFGGLFGFLGMMVGVPLFGLIYYMVTRFINRILRKKGLPENSMLYRNVNKHKDILKEEKRMNEQLVLGDLELITLNAFGYEAAFAPASGGQLVRLKKDGIDAVNVPESKEALLEAPTSYGYPLLFPPNRVDGGKFTFDGREYQFPINEPDRGNSLHGFLHNRPWKVVDLTKTSLKLEFSGTEKTDFYQYYPVKFKVTRLYELMEEGLKETVTVENTGDVDMPYGLGFHTAFKVNNDTKIKVSVGQRIEVNERMLPSGVVRDLNEKEKNLREEGLEPMMWSMDDHYTVEPLFIDGEAFHGAILEDKKSLITYKVDEFYRHWMIWNSDRNGKFVCIEPQDWRINAPNLVETLGEEAGMDQLKAGETREVTTMLTIERKG